ncbi:MAG: hypothetical protein ACYTGX_07960 [Planctomycetota bacterium]
MPTSPITRRLTVLALLLWGAAAPLLGPAHAVVHGGAHVRTTDAHNHHAGSEQRPDAPDESETEEPCVECLATPLLASAAPAPVAQPAPRTCVVTPRATPPVAAPHFGCGARAPPLVRT